MIEKLFNSPPGKSGMRENPRFFIGLFIPFVGNNRPLIKPFVGHYRPFIFNPRFSGFTLIELIVTMIVAAVLVALAAPAMTRFIQSNHLTAVTNDMIADLNLARSEAIKRGGNIGVCKSDSGAECTGSGTWNEGWIVFSDADNSGGWSVGDVILRVHESLPSTVSIGVPPSDLIMFTRQGLVSIGAGIYGLCNGRIKKKRELDVSATGRVNLNDSKTC